MKITGVQSRVVSVAIAILLLPVLAGAQGSRFPGLSRQHGHQNKHRGPIEVHLHEMGHNVPLMRAILEVRLLAFLS